MCLEISTDSRNYVAEGMAEIQSVDISSSLSV
jgi:hypothetical protein